MKKYYLLAVVLMGSYCSIAQVTNIKTNFGTPQGASLGNRVVFVNSTTGELGSTDGTLGGTIAIPTSTVVLASQTVSLLNNRIVFVGNHTTTGNELWSSDGTVAGTTLIKDINPGVASSNPEGGSNGFILRGSTLYFSADNGTNGRELWKTDGTTAGTIMVKDINASSMEFPDNVGTTPGNLMFFIVTTAANGKELWKTDGTDAGTVLLKDITAGAGSSGFAYVLAANGTHVFFLANNGINGAELWRTDGTEAGTILLTDINAGLGNSFNLTALGDHWSFHFKNNILYFHPNDGSISGVRIYRSDGTIAGTTLVKDFNPGGGGIIDLWNAMDWGNYFYFQANGELYRSDGTNAGSTLVKDINPGAGSSNPNFIRPRENLGDEYLPGLFAGGRFFFLADDGTHGEELWVSDGTTAGTILVSDIYPGLTSSFAGYESFYYTRYKLFFSANNGTIGHELWQTDGTPAGTSLVMDINPGAASSDLDFFGVASVTNKMLFQANNGDGADIYSLDATVIPFPIFLTAFNGQLKGNDVLLKWTTMQEEGFSHFNIQRSITGLAFTNIVTVSGKGTQFSANYDFLDKLPGKASTYYYRLEMVQKDGTRSYSNIISLTTRKGAGFTTTTTSTDILLHIDEVEGQALIALNDLQGHTIYKQKIQVNAKAIIRIPVGHLASGIYIVRLEHNDQLYTARIVR